MRSLTIALAAVAGLMTAAVATGASAAGAGVVPAHSPQAANVQLAQYYRGYRPYWDRPYRGSPYYHHHHYWRRWSSNDVAITHELNRQELQRLGVTPYAGQAWHGLGSYGLNRKMWAGPACSAAV